MGLMDELETGHCLVKQVTERVFLTLQARYRSPDHQHIVPAVSGFGNADREKFRNTWLTLIS
jgi:hypothetical protein